MRTNSYLCVYDDYTSVDTLKYFALITQELHSLQFHSTDKAGSVLELVQCYYSNQHRQPHGRAFATCLGGPGFNTQPSRTKDFKLEVEGPFSIARSRISLGKQKMPTRSHYLGKVNQFLRLTTLYMLSNRKGSFNYQLKMLGGMSYKYACGVIFSQGAL